PESIMPAYPWLARTPINADQTILAMRANQRVGVPYTEDMIAEARADFLAQADPDADSSGLEERYPNVQQRNFDRQPGVSEMDALVAYLQVLGTMVDFTTFQPDQHR
ncbi:MAG TPA: cytochrome-c oxidase, cbb3-type subunit II, partial [Paracoccus sp.]|nr:cytochrome-c oxidase, cbb3-type subunit II [Paracoccus sp. (in: a-proteobacteria)]